MYCPNCAAQNIDQASFCRSCGANISLVPQAMTGRLAIEHHTDADPTESGGRKSKRRKAKDEKPARIDKAFEEIFIGVAFLFIFLAGLFYFTGGFMVWVWFIIPAFACAGSGVGQYLRYKQEQQRQAQLPRVAPPLTDSSLRAARPAVASAVLPPRDTSEINSSFDLAPPSVTEATTRHLDPAPALPHASAPSRTRVQSSEDNL